MCFPREIAKVPYGKIAGSCSAELESNEDKILHQEQQLLPESTVENSGAEIAAAGAEGGGGGSANRREGRKKKPGAS